MHIAADRQFTADTGNFAWRELNRNIAINRDAFARKQKE
jgi:hypothetical protein